MPCQKFFTVRNSLSRRRRRPSSSHRLRGGVAVGSVQADHLGGGQACAGEAQANEEPVEAPRRLQPRRPPEDAGEARHQQAAGEDHQVVQPAVVDPRHDGADGSHGPREARRGRGAEGRPPAAGDAEDAARDGGAAGQPVQGDGEDHVPAQAVGPRRGHAEGEPLGQRVGEDRAAGEERLEGDDAEGEPPAEGGGELVEGGLLVAGELQ